ncbi:MAG TPA: PilZ domain-containing protein [Thermoanaerobaculia bacterium]
MRVQEHQGRRRYARVRRPRPVVVNLPEGLDCEYQRLVRVGRGGAELLCRSALPPGEAIAIEICLAGGVIRASGRVVGSRPGPEGHFVGVAFDELSPEDAALLADLLADRD